jgi:hypothetical protein
MTKKTESKVATPELEKFYFPTRNVSIEAASYEEALEKLADLTEEETQLDD